ncbi:hypothetical protein ACFRKB_17785 [Streptomyces scopuliridis]|uniref:hypothetical protein n=1 Tax=Streptomyces scopuliridis TaxID=452529 RepID=UPI0036BA7077
MEPFPRVTRIRVAAGAFAFVALFAIAAGTADDIGWPVPPTNSLVAADDIGWPGPAPLPGFAVIAEGDIGWPVPPAA